MLELQTPVLLFSSGTGVWQEGYGLGDGQEGCFPVSPLGARLLCISEERQGGIFFLLMHHCESASLGTVVGFTFWQRMGEEKVLMEVMNLMVPLLWLTFDLWYNLQNPAIASGSRIKLPLSHPSPNSLGYNIQLLPSKTPVGLGTPEEGFSPFPGGMSCSDNLGHSKIPGKPRAASHQPAHGTCGEHLEGSSLQWLIFGRKVGKIPIFA